jgi:hypothetical protein
MKFNVMCSPRVIFVRRILSIFVRRNGASLTNTSINSLLDQVPFFSQELPIFAKTGTYITLHTFQYLTFAPPRQVQTDRQV